MVLGLGMRTIWITIRAQNYTDRALAQTARSIKGLKKEEREYVTQLIRQQSAARMNIQSGILYATVIGGLTSNILGLINATNIGAEYMEEFGAIMNEVKSAFGDTLFNALKPLLEVFKGFMEIVRDNEPLRALFLILTALGVVLVSISAAQKIYNGVIANNIAITKLQEFIEKRKMITDTQAIAITKARTAAQWNLAAAVAGATGGFSLAYMLLKDTNPIFSAAIAVVLALAAAFWYLYAAESAASLGVAAALGGAAAGAAIAAATSTQSQLGIGSTSGGSSVGISHSTRRASTIYNPSSRMANPSSAETSSNGVTRQDVNIRIDQVNTKSDVDDLDSRLAKASRRTMSRNR